MIAAGTRLGPYEIVGAVGAGGMGEVYSARDTRLDRNVAIKVLAPQLSSASDFKMRFEREARVISSLNHPHICTLHDVGHSDGHDFLVMELLEGQSLAERLEKGPLPLEDVLRYAIQIAGALDRAHRSGITHRDLKPANIKLTKTGAKLLDFGLAKAPSLVMASEQAPAGSLLADDATRQKPLTTEGTILGTFQYMAPEQLEGIEADARSDVFAFGSVLYEMITGKRAFDGRTRASLIASILDREPRPISELQPLTPSPLERVVKTCLAKDPDERWQSAHDLMRELEWIRDSMSLPAAQPAAAKRSQKEWLPWAVAAIFAVVAVGATWTAIRRTGEPAQRVISAITPPADAQFIVTGDAGGPVMVSPDGRWVMYVALSGTSTALWLQSLETGQAVPLTGTDKAMFPFWSADSRSIGFFAAGRLKAVDIGSSTVRVVADAPDARGGAWGPHGEIVFTPNTQGGLFRVSANGGTPVAVTKLEAPFTTHRWPEFLPDGKRFVYLAASHGDPTGSDTGIFLGSLDGTASRKLLSTTSHAVPHGDYLLHIQTNRLVAQRLRDGALVGEPIRIRDSVLVDPGTWRSIFSVSRTGLLAYHASGAVIGSRLVWVSREGKELSEMPPRPVFDIAMSPSGEQFAVVLGDPKGAVYVHDIDRGVETRLSFGDGAMTAPLWTRDGRHVVFTSVSPGRTEIYIRRTDGSEPERLLYSTTGELRATDVTLDGSAILIDATTTRATGILALPIEGGEAETVIDGEGSEYNGRLSPDGKWIMYINADRSGRNAYLAPFPVQGGGKWQISNETTYRAWWHPNGKEILYLTADHVVSVDVSFGGGSVRLGPPKRLFPLSVNTNNDSVVMTPDGERFLVVAPARAAGVATLVSNWDAGLD